MQPLIIHIATALSILICCAGLFGLAHIATRQRIKEIGIRKVDIYKSRELIFKIL